MTAATCKTCPFWTRPEGEDVTRTGERVLGECHHAAWAVLPGNESSWSNWWCSEHPQRQRDRLAAKAMAALISIAPDHGLSAAEVAHDAYCYADAVLALAAKERP